MKLLFCDTCGFSLSEKEAANPDPSGLTLCGKCRGAEPIIIPNDEANPNVVVVTSASPPAGTGTKPTRTLNLNAIRAQVAAEKPASVLAPVPPPKKSPLTAILLGAAVLLCVAAGALLMKGDGSTTPETAVIDKKSGPPRPPVPPTPPAEVPPTEPKWAPTETDKKIIEKAASLLDQAEDYKRKNPDDVKGFRERVEKVISFYLNTPAAGEAARMLGRVRPDKPDLIGAEPVKVATPETSVTPETKTPDVSAPELPKLVATETDKRVIEGAAKLLDEADAYKMKNPADVRGYKTRLEKIVTFYNTTPAAVEAVRVLATVKLPVVVLKSFTEEEWAKAPNLLKDVNLERDVVDGKWRKENDEMICESGSHSRLQLNVAVPLEYDFKMVFTRKTGAIDVNQILGREDGQSFMLSMGCDLNSSMRLEFVENFKAEPKIHVEGAIRVGQQYTTIVQVRRSLVRVLLNGKQILEREFGAGGVRLRQEWKLKKPGSLGIGAHISTVQFHEAKLLDATTPTKLKIVSALYGDLAAGKTMDVTTKVQSQVNENALTITASNATFGGDPATGDKKHLKVEYSFDGREKKSKEAAEGAILSISNTGE